MFKSLAVSSAFIRPYQAADVPAVLALINRVQPSLPWTRAYFQWQYLDNPAGPARLWVVEAAGRPVALYAAVPRWCYQAGSGETLAWRVQDIMTHPDHRGQGWMHRLTAHGTAAVAADGQMSYAFPREARATLRCFLKHGWTQAARAPFRHTTTLAGQPASAHPVHPLPRFGPAADALWHRCRPALTQGFVRDAAYLNWRFLDRPGTAYAAFGVHRAGRLQGWMVLKTFEAEAGRRSAHVCDVLVEPDAPAVLRALLAQAFSFARTHGATLLSGWFPTAHPYAALFDEAGLHADPAFTQWLVVHHPSPPAGPEDWYLTVCDNDVY